MGSSTDPITYVAGMPRCGSSLTMQILECLGVPVVGSWPDYEAGWLKIDPFETNPDNRLDMRARLGEVPDGHAIKLLEPHLYQIPKRPTRSLLMVRHYPDQAASMGNLSQAVVGRNFTASERKRLARAFARDMVTIQRKLASYGEVRAVRFEELLMRPELTVRAIADFVGRDYNPQAAELVVQREERVLGLSPCCGYPVASLGSLGGLVCGRCQAPVYGYEPETRTTGDEVADV